jgi:D-alanine-D-alanine ligase
MTRRPLRVALLCHEDLAPPESLEGYSDAEVLEFRTEYDVATAISALGHEVRVLGVSHDLVPIRECVAEFRPHVIFNLLMEFRDVGSFVIHVVSYFELLGVRYTGCNPQGLTLARNKALAKKILRYHRIPTPAFHVFRRGRSARPPKGLAYPMIVKSVDEDASFGVSQASVVRDAEALRERVEFVHRNVETHAIAEQYVEGRELTIGILGNQRLDTLPVWEMRFDKLPEGSLPIATERAKWSTEYQERVGIETGPARISEDLARRIQRLARRTYRAREHSGDARLDLRLTGDERVYVIEANPNPDLALEEDFAESARAAGLDFDALVQRILNLGMSYRPPWSDGKR